MSTLSKSALGIQKSRAFEHILCATDFSFCSERALIYSSAIAQRYGSELFVVHALAPETLQVLSPTDLPGAFDQAAATQSSAWQRLCKIDTCRVFTIGPQC